LVLEFGPNTWSEIGAAMEKQTTIDAEIESEELRGLKQQVLSLSQKLEQLQTEMAQQSGALAELAAKLAGTTAPGQAGSASSAAAHESEISPEMLVIIAAAVSTFLGKKIRIRSARMLQSPYEIINPWSQQGRVSVQASHTLRWER
jgi:methylmalonyl-CoA carboxyltransferase large subunit